MKWDRKHKCNLGRQKKVHLHFFFKVSKKNALFLSGSVSLLSVSSLKDTAILIIIYFELLQNHPNIITASDNNLWILRIIALGIFIFLWKQLQVLLYQWCLDTSLRYLWKVLICGKVKRDSYRKLRCTKQSVPKEFRCTQETESSVVPWFPWQPIYA